MPPVKVPKRRKTRSGKGRAKSRTPDRVKTPFSVDQMSDGPDIQLSPLGVEVPEIESAATADEVHLEYDYQWENPVLFDTIYDREETDGHERLNALRQFLYLMRELELEGAMPQNGEELTQEQINELLNKDREEIAREKGELAFISTNRSTRISKIDGFLATKNTELKTAKSAQKTALKVKRARQVRSIKSKAEKNIKTYTEEGLAKADKNIAWTERMTKKKNYDVAAYEKKKGYWLGQKQKWVDKIATEQAKIDAIMPEYNELVAPFAQEVERLSVDIAALKAEKKDLKAQNKEADKRVKELDGELKSVERVAKGQTSSVVKWKKDRYTRQLKTMDHQSLMDSIEDLFASDPNGDRFPQWIRYAVMQYSGVRYASSHNNFYSPQNMLSILKDKELEEASSGKRSWMKGKGLELIHLDPTLAGVGTKTGKKLAKAYKKTLPDAFKKKLSEEDYNAFQQIQTLEDISLAHYVDLQEQMESDGKYEEAQKKIDELERGIRKLEATLSEKGKKTIDKARARRKSILLQVYMTNTQAKIRRLNDLQALNYLQQMYDAGQIPDVVWEEIKTFTQLRINTDDPNWEAPKDRKGLKDVVGKTPEEEKLLESWRAIMTKKTMYYNSTGWRAHHAETLSPLIVTQMVCDQLGSMLQHVRGHKRKGGLRNNALYYQGMAGAGGAFFKNPTDVSDFKRGASIYWIGWSDLSETKEYKTHKSSISKKEGKIKRLRKKNEDLDKRIKEKKGRGKNRRLKYSEKKRKEYQDTITANKNQIVVYENEIAQMNLDSVPMHKYTPEKTGRPDISNIVTPTAETAGTFSIGNWKIVEGKHADGWTYKVSEDVYNKKTVKTIMRVRPNEPLCTDDSCLEFTSAKNPKVVKQWMKWRHEATIFYGDDKKVLTFDTGTKFDGEKVKGMGLRKRHTSDLLNNPLVWVGWAPTQVENALVSPYLLDSVVPDELYSAP